MDSISIRYGEDVTLPLDTGDLTATSADIYIGKPGETYVLTKNITLSAGLGVFEFTDTETRIPIDTYYYQINVTNESGAVEKYPSPQGDCDGCSDGFPKFTVHEALDLTEVS